MVFLPSAVFLFAQQMHQRHHITLAFFCSFISLSAICAPADAFHIRSRHRKAAPILPSNSARTQKQAPNKPPSNSNTEAQEEQNANAPLLTPPSLFDITTAKFGALDISLMDSSFLEASVHALNLHADKVDFTKGTANALSIHTHAAEFQDFTVDDLALTTEGEMKFDVPKLLNEKVLQFATPANAKVHVVVSQTSLNSFLNSPEVLARLSGSARKRVPILSTLAKQNVTFGFNFQRSHLLLEPNNHVHLTMEAKLGMGNGGMPVALSAETSLALENGWVNLTDTKLSTGGALVPHEMAAKIVRRINSLSKWGSKSNDIQFQFTELQVMPEDRLELTGTAQIARLEFGHDQDTVVNGDEKTKTVPAEQTKAPPEQTKPPAAEQTKAPDAVK